MFVFHCRVDPNRASKLADLFSEQVTNGLNTAPPCFSALWMDWIVLLLEFVVIYEVDHLHKWLSTVQINTLYSTLFYTQNNIKLPTNSQMVKAQAAHCLLSNNST